MHEIVRISRVPSFLTYIIARIIFQSSGTENGQTFGEDRLSDLPSAPQKVTSAAHINPGIHNDHPSVDPTAAEWEWEERRAARMPTSPTGNPKSSIKENGRFLPFNDVRHNLSLSLLPQNYRAES